MNTLYEEMNLFLSNQILLSMKIHNIHWFLKGDKFYTIHREMDTLYEEAEERIDLIAERLLAIGGNPVPNLKEVLALGTVKELDTTLKTAAEGLTLLSNDFKQLRNLTLQIIRTAEANDDPGTADHFTAIVQDLEKNIWMFDSFLK